MDNATFNRLKLLIEPCQTPEELDNFLRAFLNIQLPWDIVDENSTSSSLKFLWDVYHVMLTGKGPTKHVAAASRNVSKTLSASIIQFLSMLHFRRDGAHVAGTLNQSAALISYLDKHLMIPELAPYRNIDNYRTKQFINLPPNDFTSKPDAKIAVVTATKKGANSPRASCLEGRTLVSSYFDSDLVRRDSCGNNKGRFRPLSLDGIYRRFNRGEEIYVATSNNKNGVISFSCDK